MKSFDEEQTTAIAEHDVLKALKKGEPVICNCNIGFMLRHPVSDGVLECATEASAIRGKAEAEHVRKAVESWSRQLQIWDAAHGGRDETE